MIFEAKKIKTVKPIKPVAIKSIGISYSNRYHVNEFIMLQDVLSLDEYKEQMITHASITVRNKEGELITGHYATIEKYAKENPIELIAVNFPKMVLQKISSKYDIKDHRLLVSGFDPYFKYREAGKLDYCLLDALTGKRPENALDVQLPSDLSEVMVKSFKASDIYFMRHNETIVDLMKNASDALMSRLYDRPTNISNIIVSTLTPRDIYRGAKGIRCNDKLMDLNNPSNMIPVIELHEGCIGFLLIMKLIAMFAHSLDGDDILAYTGDALASISGSDWKCRALCSDGASATLFGQCEEGFGILGASCFNVPEIHNLIKEDYLAGGLLMNGAGIHHAIREYYPSLVSHAIKTFGFDRKKVKIISHQMNGAIISGLSEILNKNKPMGESDIHQDQIINTFRQFGNSSSSTVPTALYQSLVDQRFEKGDEVLFIALGAGFNMGYVGYRINKELLESFS